MAFLSEVIDSKNEIMKKYIITKQNGPESAEKLQKLKAQIRQMAQVVSASHSFQSIQQNVQAQSFLAIFNQLITV